MTKYFSKKETLLLLYYTFAFTMVYFIGDIIPGSSSVHGPGLDFFLFVLLIPISVLYFIIQAYKYFNTDESYLKCLWIHIFIWVITVLYLRFDVFG
ncbi:hypothetical protein [Flavobacterium sp.]|uniref:hypothetical protein n=1 Tax=Flavobacterium sp. TaxID=239 RepID=UPI003D6C0B78